jgi:hypothetical protein
MDFSKIIKALDLKGVVGKFSDKRILTPKLPLTTRIKLYRAAIATKKPVSSVLSTAIETYLISNDEKHLAEIQAMATLRGCCVEDILIDEISKRFEN